MSLPPWFGEWQKLRNALLPLHINEVRKSSSDTRSGQATLNNALSFLAKQLANLTQGTVSWQGFIDQASDFPRPSAIDGQWMFKTLSAVTDNDPTRTNTGQVFAADDLILWDGYAWVVLASAATTPVSTATNTVYTLPAPLPVGVAINTQTGAYPGGPAVLDGPALTLGITGAAFVANGNTLVFVNGLLQNKGSGLGIQDAQWVSSTQLAFAFELFPDDVVTIRTEL